MSPRPPVATHDALLEEQSETGAEPPADLPPIDHAHAFEAGPRLLVGGLARSRPDA